MATVIIYLNGPLLLTFKKVSNAELPKLSSWHMHAAFNDVEQFDLGKESITLHKGSIMGIIITFE